jgi:membrane fusion protein (multidrug efflux system)
VFVDVPQSAVADMTIGTRAVAVANSLPGREFHGTVARTSSAIDPSARTLRVEVDIPNPDGALLPGMYLQVTFQVHLTKSLEVPASAMIFRAAGPQVAVIDADSKVRFHDVTIADDEGDKVDLDGGIAVGDRVVLNISDQIAEGTKVQAVESNQPPPPPSNVAGADGQ